MHKKLAVMIVALSTALSISISPAHGLHSLEKIAKSKALSGPGLLVMNPSDGTVLSENAPDSLRIPASVLKLVSTAAALHFLGPDTQYTTKIFSTANPGEFVIKGTLDPWLTSNLSFSKKNQQPFLPALINKANKDGLKKLKIYYSGLFERDLFDLSVNQKAKQIKLNFEQIEKQQVAEIATEEIHSLTSQPLSEMVKFVNLWSDNRLADRLAKDAARKIGYQTSGKGLTTTFKQALNELGVDHTGLKVKDGSGLSKQNQVSARTIVELLNVIRVNPLLSSIYEGLPVAGKTGTLQKRFLETAPNAVGMVRAKTGWVNNSVTLAGYVKEGETEYAFAILADGITPTLSARNKARAAMDRLLGAIVTGNH